MTKQRTSAQVALSVNDSGVPHVLSSEICPYLQFLIFVLYFFFVVSMHHHQIVNSLGPSFHRFRKQPTAHIAHHY